MKYIVLSFDDGLADFKDNALPILEKYGFNASLNVVSSFIEKKNNIDYEYMNESDLIDLYKKGFEIAVHSNSHSKNETSQDIEICLLKLKTLFGDIRFGYITPYSINPSDEVLEYLTSNNYLYCADCKVTNRKTSTSIFIKRVFNHFYKSDKIQQLINNYKYIYKVNFLSKNYFYCFHRVCVTKTFNFECVKKLIKYVRNNQCLTLMFHSILKSDNEKCPWPNGSWTVEEFEQLLKYLKSNKRIKVVIQKDLFKYYVKKN